MKKLIFLIALIFLTSLSSVVADEAIEIVYFYGEGCPHCANLEVFLSGLKNEYNITTTSFEVYKSQEHRELASKMAIEYGDSFRGVPMIFIGDDVLIGFSEDTGAKIKEKIEHCMLDDCCDSPLDNVKKCKLKEAEKEKLTFGAVVALAFADSINPCALAVLAMALIALLVKNPKKKKQVLLGGLMFSLAVFITYIIYGGIIIQFFKVIGAYFASLSYYVRILFAGVAILLGAMNIKDSIKYKPGSFGTEMPIKIRPVVKKLLQKITSPMGAFVMGVFVTLFLLPCTIGPYLVVGNLLSAIDWIKVFPWLVLYNFIFVLPMLVVTLIVYFGMKRVQDVTGWKDKHIKMLHLIAGIVLAILGIAMLLGWV